jgi:Lrp/AsnC family leucine-responsive transcriptional regulator
MEISALSTTDELLRLLMADGRITWADLAKHVGLTPPAVAERVRRLEESGTIRGYTAMVDPHAAGCDITAFAQVTLDAPAHRSEFVSRVLALDEVQECHHVAGEYDYLLKLRCRDIQRLDRLLSDEIKGVPGVTRTMTTIVLGTLKETAILPLPDRNPS